METVKKPRGYNTVNPFIVTRNARKYIEFVVEVFGAIERKQVFTVDTDDLVLHAELEIDDSAILCFETKKGWPVTPGFLQVYVVDAEKTLQKAESLGATIVTRPTDFYGDVFSRMLDPFGNLWWVYQHKGEIDWSSIEATDDPDEAAWDQSSGELNYIHETIMQVMPKLVDNG